MKRQSLVLFTCILFAWVSFSQIYPYTYVSDEEHALKARFKEWPTGEAIAFFQKEVTQRNP
jgi:hypothetical protein